MKYLFDCWHEIEEFMRPYRRTYILTDYDGTLTPIVDYPDQAILNPNVRDLLKSLVKDRRFILAIITGRTLKEIIQLIGIEGAYYIGNHGLEIKGPSLTFVHPMTEKLSLIISKICNDMKSKFESNHGVIVEDKGMTASIHYRMAPKNMTGEIKKVVRNTVRSYEDFEIRHGKMVVEIRPKVLWDKGDAVLWLVRKLGEDGIPIYIGDDKTDEDAFRKIDRGLTILVSKRRRHSNARYYLKSAEDVHEFLYRLLDF
ncbi:MAG: trehalose-phosphatase [Nitrososphaerales archaeon]|nr:trehalose-phosphatase [Nitrososphaerales archaeon]